MTLSPHSERTLILDGDMVPTLTIARSLARRGVEIDIASHVPHPVASYSRHVRRTLIYPNPLTDEAGYLAWVKRLLRLREYALVIPVTERTLVPLRHLATEPLGACIAIAPPTALDVALNKNRTIELAIELDIPVPATYLIDRLDQLDRLPHPFRMPVVVKPGCSIGTDTHERRQLSVEYAFDQRGLEACIEHQLRFGSVLLQEYVRGEGVGIELIANHGEIIYAFQHRRLHEVPLTGGGSSLRESVRIVPELLEASRRLIRKLGWHGVAMVEFKQNPGTGDFWLMELNGRFWGSLPLAVAAGADFPAMLLELMRDGKVGEHPPYRTGIRCCKLSSDIYWYEQILRAPYRPQLFEKPHPKQLLLDSIKLLGPHSHFDVQSWRDPLPGLVDLLRIGVSYSMRLAGRINKFRRLATLRKPWRDGHAAARIGQARRLLFICYGNINRSALAERYFHSLPASRHVEAISAGFHETEGRPADPVMVEVAAASGIDLRDWSSRKVTRDMIDASDVVLVMEDRHYRQIATLFPDAAERTFLLGMAADARGEGEIADPYGRPRHLYERCAGQVRGGVDAIAGLLRHASGQG